jgi:hypothetical protein
MVLRLEAAQTSFPQFQTSSPLFQLEQALGANWSHLRSAYSETQTVLMELSELLNGKPSADSSIVVTGSLGRMEYTKGSDLDWILLVDGDADARDQKTYLEIDRTLHGANRFKKPGREGTFGKLAFSQPIVHYIGGEEDFNSNTTRRVLLLLEAVAIGESRAFERVRKGILLRYLNEDRGLFQRDHKNRIRWVPLFLLNDLARYWRTMTVDFAYKQFNRGNRGYALRSVKLGISRKLMFASGLLACFWCDPEISRNLEQEPHLQTLIAQLDEFLSWTPLERLALFFFTHLDGKESDFLKVTAMEVFGAYDDFLKLLNVQRNRKRLEQLTKDKEESDAIFKKARLIRKRFREAIHNMFLDNRSPLYTLTIDKGVF